MPKSGIKFPAGRAMGSRSSSNLQASVVDQQARGSLDQYGGLSVGSGSPRPDSILSRTLNVSLRESSIPVAHKRQTHLQQFSPSLIDRLSSPPSPADSQKSSPTDEIIRRRLAAESAQIRSQEAEILSSISAALEKENLDREKPGMSSEVLGRDIEEIKGKIERMKRDRDEKEGEGIRKAKESIVKCYR